MLGLTPNASASPWGHRLRRLVAALPMTLNIVVAGCGSNETRSAKPPTVSTPAGSAVRGRDPRLHWPTLEPGERYGIDVSHHQGVIDWDAVAADDIEFAYLKATEGGDHVDRRFAENWEAAQAAGLGRGAYHYFTFCRSGADQAANFLREVPRDPAAMPPALDLELAGNCAARPTQEEMAVVRPSVVVEGDAFFRFLRSGIEPWLPEAEDQNQMVVDAAGAAAGRFASTGMPTVFDGVLGPWHLEEFVAASGVEAIDYAVLLPRLPVVLLRVQNREDHPFDDRLAAEHMHNEFRRADIDPRHVFAQEDSPEEIAELVVHARSYGRLEVRR